MGSDAIAFFIFNIGQYLLTLPRWGGVSGVGCEGVGDEIAPTPNLLTTAFFPTPTPHTPHPVPLLPAPCSPASFDPTPYSPVEDIVPVSGELALA